MLWPFVLVFKSLKQQGKHILVFPVKMIEHFLRTSDLMYWSLNHIWSDLLNHPVHWLMPLAVGQVHHECWAVLCKDIWTVWLQKFHTVSLECPLVSGFSRQAQWWTSSTWHDGHSENAQCSPWWQTNVDCTGSKNDCVCEQVGEIRKREREGGKEWEHLREHMGCISKLSQSSKAI